MSMCGTGGRSSHLFVRIEKWHLKGSGCGSAGAEGGGGVGAARGGGGGGDGGSCGAPCATPSATPSSSNKLYWREYAAAMEGD